jgi:hypothetical protein
MKASPKVQSGLIKEIYEDCRYYDQTSGLWCSTTDHEGGIEYIEKYSGLIAGSACTGQKTLFAIPDHADPPALTELVFFFYFPQEYIPGNSPQKAKLLSFFV